MNNNYLKNEKGSTLLVVMGLLMAAIFISFIFFDFFTTFAAKRVGQTSADSAALAAAEEAKQIYDKELKKQIKDRLEKLKSEQEAEEEGSDDVEPPEDGGISTPLPGIGDALFGKEMPPGVEKWINGSIVDLDSLDLNEALKYLFEQDEINKISCGSIEDAFPQIEEAARHYAKINGAEDDIEVEFPYEGEFKVFVKVKKKAEFVTVEENMFSGDENKVRAEAAVNIATPKGIDISCD